MSVMLASYYLSLKVQLPLVRLAETWRGDCSEVDRCWRLSVSLVNEGKPTNFVCAASLASQLPMWSNNRQCAECPQILNFGNSFSSADACDPLEFGHMDDLAGAYFDFWSGEKARTTRGHDGDLLSSLLSSRHPFMSTLNDANGPYVHTCSESRQSNGHGHAGRTGGYYCIDCFGNDCADRSFEDRAAANSVKKKHCEERFACPAFDFDQGYCDKNFFSAVCNATDGYASAYPRRFSDLPGFAFFRHWPHSFVDSCSTSLNPTNATTLLTASGRAITARERLRLRALCQLHRRCVREHPDIDCELGAFERHDKRMLERAGERDAQTWWNLPVSVARHQLRLGGMWQLASAIFIFYIVACDVARTYHVSSQNLLFLKVAAKERRRRAAALVWPLDASKHEEAVIWPRGWLAKCRHTVLGWAARFLQHSLRDGLVPIALWPSYNAVLAVSTPLDVFFCGTIMLIVLQLDNFQMHTLLTDKQQLELATQYTVLVTRKQEEMLERELLVVFWSAWAWLIISYVTMVQIFGDVLMHPDRNDGIKITVPVMLTALFI